MQKIFSLLALAICLMAVSCSDDEPAPIFPNAPVNPDQSKMLALVNDARANSTNCGPNTFQPSTSLAWSDTLAMVAEKHSEDMAAADKLSHTGTDGSFLQDRLEREGYFPVIWAENLAKGATSEEEVVDLWLESEGHCENIMNADVFEMGIGTSGPYWTMVLAKRLP